MPLTEVDKKQLFALAAKITPAFPKNHDGETLHIRAKVDVRLEMATQIDQRRRTP